MNSKSYFINAAGKLIRAVENEAIQTFYVMTKNPPSNIEPKVLTNTELLSFIERKPEDYTFEFFSDLKEKLHFPYEILYSLEHEQIVKDMFKQ